MGICVVAFREAGFVWLTLGRDRRSPAPLDRGARTALGCGAALIAQPDDGGDWRGIERESGNITAILPQAFEAPRAALPHPCRDDEAVDRRAEGAFRRASRIAVAGTLNAL